jgi:hypothetical protein
LAGSVLETNGSSSVTVTFTSGQLTTLNGKDYSVIVTPEGPVTSVPYVTKLSDGSGFTINESVSADITFEWTVTPFSS